MAMTMTKRARVLAALRGDRVDRVPLSFWLHNFVTENSAEGLAAETLRLARTFDWDFLKPQSRAQCFAEMWGLRYAPSQEQAVQYTVTHVPLATEADLLALAPVDPRAGALGEQLEALRRIRAAVGADGLFYATNVATQSLMSAAECRRFQRPFDLRVLAAVDGAPFNLLHV